MPKIIPRQEANRLCQKCLRSCRQSQNILLLQCPRFEPMPFKIAEAHFKQLDLFKD